MTAAELDLDPERRQAIGVEIAVSGFLRAGDRSAARVLGSSWARDDGSGDPAAWERCLAGVEATLRRRGCFEVIRFDERGDPI